MSFPSYKGFSGSPLIIENTLELVGMLYNNHEIQILQHSILDYQNENSILYEKLCKVMEFGLAHTAEDIKIFMNEIKHIE